MSGNAQPSPTPQYDEATSLMTYEQASTSLLPLKVSADTLRRAASVKLTPIRKRLKVVRIGHRTVGIRKSDLQDWLNRCAT